MPPRKRKKASELEGDELLNYLLTDPSSKIGTMDINVRLTASDVAEVC
jgi:hypothetical protein